MELCRDENNRYVAFEDHHGNIYVLDLKLSEKYSNKYSSLEAAMEKHPFIAAWLAQ